MSLAGVTYNLRTIYMNADQGGWILDIADGNNTPIVSGIPLVTGADLLAQYAYLGIGGSLYVSNPNDPGASPTFGSLGDTSSLYFVTP